MMPRTFVHKRTACQKPSLINIQLRACLVMSTGFYFEQKVKSKTDCLKEIQWKGALESYVILHVRNACRELDSQTADLNLRGAQYEVGFVCWRVVRVAGNKNCNIHCVSTLRRLECSFSEKDDGHNIECK